MSDHLLRQLKQLRGEFLDEGFEILGYFGSRARGEETASSDLDILYILHEPFYSRNPGWEAIGRIEEIRTFLSSELSMKIDLANRNGLNPVSKKYIAGETVYVA